MSSLKYNTCQCCTAALFSLLFLFQGCKKDEPQRKFTSLAPEQTGISFANNILNETPDGMNIIQYLYYYNGGGVATGDLNNDGLTDLFFTSNLASNRLYLNKGLMHFEDISEKAGIEGTKGTWNTGVALVDINADGWLDIYVSRVGNYKKWHGRNQLFINNQNGTFSDKAAEFGLDISAFSTQANFIDIDNDGDLDCFLLCHSVHSAASYQDTSQTRKKDPLAADRLLLCEQIGNTIHYRDVSDAYGIIGGTAGYGLGIVAGDINGDNYTDIYVSNDFHENDYLYINQKGKGFKESIAAFTGHVSNFSMGCDMADYNNDALPDLITLDMKPEDEFTLKASQPADLFEVNQLKHTKGYHWQYPRNALLLNQTSSPDQIAASEIAYFAGIAATDWSWSALFTDLDLDGWKDLYITNGIVRRPNDMDFIRYTSSDDVQRNATDLQLLEKMPDGSAANYCFKNTGFLDFKNVSNTWGLDLKGCSNGAAYADLDNDGDIDLVTNNINQPASLWQNNTLDTAFKKTDPNYLKIQLRGKGTNTFAIGAKVWIHAKDTMQYFENQPIRGFQSCVEPGMIYIGLGTTTTIDSVKVCWPDGTSTTQLKVSANQKLVLQQEGNTPFILNTFEVAALNVTQVLHSNFPEPLNDIQHFSEKLQPWSLTDLGTKPAISNTLLFVPGHGGGDMYRWNNAGNAELVQKITFAGKGICAALFDANGDKLDDLYVGTAPDETNPNGTDWLFLNLNGRFEPASPQMLPLSPVNTSCVTTSDFDGDGDIDIFAGGRSVPGAYGVAPRSYLLENDGKGVFKDVTEAKAPKLANIGMVTDAHWANMDQLGKPDLVICGEWMPIYIFADSKDGLSGTTIPESSGLWNTIALADFDQDGDTDIMGGNFGTNAILSASVKHPLELWVKDFDNNGQIDPVMAYYRNGKKYPFADKDLLISQMPFLKKRYISYRNFASNTFDQVFPADLQKDAHVLQAATLRSTIFEQKPKGLWTISPLVDPLQWAPIFAIAADQLDENPGLDVWIGGNTHQISPAIGRMDALPVTQAVFIESGQFIPILTDYGIKGAIRSIQKGKKKMIIATDLGDIYIIATQ
jgi:enediyne biosynthesis protein E4